MKLMIIIPVRKRVFFLIGFLIVSKPGSGPVIYQNRLTYLSFIKIKYNFQDPAGYFWQGQNGKEEVK